MEEFPTLDDIKKAEWLIGPHIHHTPVFTSETINKLTGNKVYFKCENFQKGGSFKIRGATNAILSLSAESLKNGVATHSSGNHAQAVAIAASQNGTKAYVVMPENAPKIKLDAVLGYRASVIPCAPNLKSRENTVLSVIEETGAAFIHPYNNLNVIAGQATVAMELLKDIPDLEIIMAPIGGGGLISGIAMAAAYVSPHVKVIGAEPKGADDTHTSLIAGKIIEKEAPFSIADGLLSTVGTINFNIIQKYVHSVNTVEEEEIVSSMKLIWERMKIIIEPSAAVTVAALLKNCESHSSRKIGVILSGGNVDLGRLPFKQW